ncbi:filamentous hemagglutinin N-terminal domain-containing protein [Pseudomonas sp. OV546]|nr:filamentous hemagglutinin N-terminal domain-containing protein [Pseudomonas sp. OV546]SFU33934.1 filamentous hemagglutinin [Pseudomonas sp. OV546]
MDVRQFAFLARQPSAALKSRSNFLGLPKRGLALVLANAMFWQPLLAQADGIVVSAPGTTLGQAGNGVPIVNIAAPNGSGLSHNQFQDYNVGQQGVILNNATGRTQSTQLGGIILGNQNLNGTAASVILNEVNGGSPSQLRGFTEVAGQSAHVIVANPYGITCNGCGFINTPQATLTTGKAVIENGQVSRYQVDQGSVTVEGAELNANNIDRFEIITRSAKINAEIQAKNLTIIAGANDVDAKTLKATARAAAPATKPQLAIDSSALGGMYAGAIRLVSSEAGVGVKLDGKMVASGGDIQLEANGDLSLAQATAAEAVVINARSLYAQDAIYAGTRVEATTQGTLTNRRSIAAQDSVKLASDGQLNNLGMIEAGVTPENTRNQTGDVTLAAKNIDNRGQSVIASRDLKATVTETLDNRAGTLSANTGMVLNAQDLDNRGGTLISQGTVKTTLGGTLDNRDNGTLASSGEQTLTAATVKNTKGVVSSQDTLGLDVASLDNSSGKITAKGALTLGGTTVENGKGQITSQGDILATAKTFNQQGGKLISQGQLTLAADTIDNSLDGYIASANAMALTAHEQLTNTGKGIISTQQGLTINGGAVDNTTGSLLSQSGITATLSGGLNNQDGSVITQTDNLNIEANNVDNRGGVLASVAGTLKTTLATVLDNGKSLTAPSEAGLIQAQSLNLGAQQSVLNNGGQISALTGDTEITTSILDNQNGALLAKQFLTVRATDLNNTQGRAAADAIDFGLTGELNNQSGLVEGSSGLVIDAASINNQNGKLRSLGQQGTASVASAQLLDNQSGMIEAANHDVSLRMASFKNTDGNVRHVGTGTFGVDLAKFSNIGGSVATAGTLTVDAATWDNSTDVQADVLNVTVGQFNQAATGKLAASQSFTGKGDTWTNAGRITSGGAFSLTATNVINTGTLGGAGAVELNADAVRNDRGLIFSGTDMALRFKNLTNYYADIYSLGGLSMMGRDGVARSGSLENISSHIEAASDVLVRSDSVINRKDVFSTIDEAVSGYLSVTCYDCGGDHHNVDYVAHEVSKSVVATDSASSSIQSGAKLTVDGSSVLNKYSTMASGADLLITADNFANIGATTGISTRTRTWNTGRVTDGTDERFRANWINPYNAQPNPKVLPVGALNSFSLVGDTTTVTPGDPIAAVIQAAGNVNIQATQQLENSSIVQFTPPKPVGDKGGATTVAQPAVVVLNPQLPPDLAQQQVNPTTMPGFTLPTGQSGLFHLVDSAAAAKSSQDLSQANIQASDASRVITGPKYMVVTDPALTDLKQFMSSDYLLGKLGYDPETSWRRLGDGLYEQRLIQQAVTARTGQRFIDGQTTDEGMFKYLMNNAIASKEQLNLAVGVTLTSQQVAALTHDIVWMEDQVINGEHVLVPVLYMAQANNRLTADGALIQGKDVTLIAGADLKNAGTLRASENLSAAAGNNLVNTRLAEAGEKLKLVAGKDLVNMQGGILKGKDVELSTLTGDIRNDRTITTIENSGKGFSSKTAVVDSAASIEAGNNLTMHAARDLLNVGGAITAGKNAELSAGNDVVIAAAREETGSMRQDKRHFWEQSQTVQHASEIKVGGDLDVVATNELTMVASHVKAGSDVNLSGKDVNLLAAANEESTEYRYKRSGKKVNQEEDHIRQQGTTIDAGGDVNVAALNDVTMVASKINAGNEAYLVAGNQMNLLAELNRDYSLYDMTKKGSWGSNAAKRDEVTQHTNVGSEIKTGGDLTLKSGGDQRYQVATLDSGKDLTLDSGGRIVFEGVKDFHDESHTKSKGDLAWYKMKGEGKTDETLRQSALIAQGKLVIKAAEGIRIDIKQVDQQSVSQTIDAMVQADPNLAWMKQAEARGDIDWRQVKEIHDSFKYESSGLGAGAKIAIAILMSFIMGPAGFGLQGANLAVATSLSTTAVTSTIDNKGNLGLAIKETFSAGSLKNAAVAGVTAGLIDYADTKWFSDASGATNGGSTVVSSGPIQNPGYASSMLKPENWANTLLRSGTHALINGSVSTVITGGSLGSNLGEAFIGEGIELGAAIGNKKIGDLAANLDVAPKIAEKLVLHAALGGLIAKARGESFASGAIAGGVAQGLTPIANGLLAEYVSSRFEAADLSAAGSQLKIGTAQIIGLIAAGAAGGNPETGSLIGGTAEKYNDQGFHLDPTDQFNDDGLPPQNTPSDVDKLKAEISLFILMGLVPELLGGAAEGFIARITGMFSKSSSEALAGAGTRAGAGGASEIGAKAGGAVAEGAGAAAEEIVAGAKGNQLINGTWVDAEGLPLPVPSSVGASGRVPNVLQTGGNTLNKSTANALNEHFGESLAPREWGRALEALKADAGKLPNNFHGRILDNGDYVGKAGEVIGNIRDYLP